MYIAFALVGVSSSVLTARKTGGSVDVLPLFGVGDLVDGVDAGAGRVAASAGVNGRAELEVWVTLLLAFGPSFFLPLFLFFFKLSAFLFCRNAISCCIISGQPPSAASLYSLCIR